MRRLSLLLSLLLITAAPVPASAAEPSPAFELRRGSETIEARTDRQGRLWIELPFWVRAHERAFELHVGRSATTDPIQVFWQSDAGPRLLPEHAVTTWRTWGLSRFFQIFVFDRKGNKIRQRHVSWCPSGWERARIVPGAEDERYPFLCGGNPLTRYQVWGIERGWASGADMFMRYKLRPGTYRMEVRVAKPYRQALALKNTVQSFQLKVRAGGGGGGLDPFKPFTTTTLKHESPQSGPTSTGAQRPGNAKVAAVPDPSTVPDLASLPAWSIRLDPRGKRQFLSFAATVWNAGPAPLLVDGFRREGEAVMDAFQTFVDADGTAIGHDLVGEFEYDDRPGHFHWHFTDFAEYRLLTADEHLAVRSGKESFCLAPTDAQDLLVPRATWLPEHIGFSQCGWERSISIREVLPAGWGDTYIQSIAGQSFDVTKLPDGKYLIEVIANPDGRLHEVTADNNRALRRITLWTDASGRRRVTVPPYLGPL